MRSATVGLVVLLACSSQPKRDGYATAAHELTPIIASARPKVAAIFAMPSLPLVRYDECLAHELETGDAFKACTEAPAAAAKHFVALYGADALGCDVADAACLERSRVEVCHRVMFTQCVANLCESASSEIAQLATIARDQCASAGHELFQFTQVHFADTGAKPDQDLSAVATERLEDYRVSCPVEAPRPSAGSACLQTLRCGRACLHAWDDLGRGLDAFRDRAAKASIDVPRLRP